MPGYATYLVETIVTLLLVCVVAVAVLYGARKLGLGRASGPIALLGQLPLDARRSVYLVGIGQKVIVVGVAEGGMVKLAELGASEVPAAAARSTEARSFSEILDSLRGRDKPSKSVDAPSSDVAIAREQGASDET
jgi:flagellar biogenesis protein FliO